MDKYYKWKVLLIIGITIFCIWKAYPLNEKIKLGLDLQGGMQLLLQVDMDKVPEEAKRDVTDRVAQVIRNRFDDKGIKEPDISKQGHDQVVVQLPGVTNRDEIKGLTEKTAFLEFRLVSDDPNLIEKAEQGQVPEGYEYKKVKGSPTEEMVLLEKKSALTGEHLTNASVGFDQYGEAIVQLSLDPEGGKIFDKVTFQNIGKRLAIVLDGVVHSAPVIRDRIPNGKAQISGNFKAAEASDLALVLRAPLPAPVSIIEERTVGPSLGRDSIQKGIKACLLGVLFIIVFMPVYYLLCGLVADFGLIIYMILVVGSLATLGATLTLPGIAGLILSVGMAVDANVLIYERIREELVAGKTSRAAISSGYHRAFSAILDSNVTTLITSMLLFIFGTGPIQGFAVTLSLGVVASMFSAIVVTRVVFDFLLKRNPNLQFKMLHIFTHTKIPFMKLRYLAYIFSVICIGLGVAAFMLRGSENYGIEFTGGTFAQIGFNKNIDIADFRKAISDQGIKSFMLQRFGDAKGNQYAVKVADQDTKRIEAAATKVVGEGNYDVLRVDAIGPSVSTTLRDKAFLAFVWASVGILLYLSIRFEWKLALSAVVALIHDTLFTFGVYALLGREINLATVAAILTVMGYSVNDTIINFDRIRDNLKLMRKTPFKDVVNTSINQTLGRTVLTVFTTLLAACSLYFFGGPAIHDFAFILIIGFAVGTYSSIFVASALAVDWKAHK